MRWVCGPRGKYEVPPADPEPSNNGPAFILQARKRLPFAFLLRRVPSLKMKPLYEDRIVDRQVGRNAQLFAESIADLAGPRERYPYLRILVALLEQAHPEWSQAPEKDRQIAELAQEMSGGHLDPDEVAVTVRARDAERGTRPGRS